MAGAPIEEMFADACLGARSDAELSTELSSFLDAHGVPREDAEAICASPPRLALYRRLVRNNLVGVVGKMMPRTRARMNALANAFDEALDAFLAEVGPRTHYLREVPRELFTWAAPIWRARADVPRYLVDLAEHELSEFEVAAMLVPAPPEASELALDRPLVFGLARRLQRYGFAVHELPEDVSARGDPEERPCVVLVYRDDEDAVHALELSPGQARALEALFDGRTLGQATTVAGAAPDEVAAMLATLGEHGFLLGAATPAAS